MGGRYEGYYWNILAAKEEAKKKRKEKERQARLKRLNDRLNQPLFKKGGRTKMKQPLFKEKKKNKIEGSKMKVSVSAGIKGLLRV